MRTTRTADAAKTVKDILDANPEIRLVLEISKRARALESLTPPIDLGSATETIVIPISSQGLVPAVPPS